MHSLADEIASAPHVTVEGILALRQEVKRRRIAEEVYRKGAARLIGITATLQDGVMVVDSHGHIVFSNPAARSLLGFGFGFELTGTDLDDAMHFLRDNEPVEFDLSPIPDAIRTGETVHDDDATFLTAAGRRVSVSYTVAPLHEDTRLVSAVVTFRDIEALKAARREAMHASRLASVGQLAAGIAHEINTPVQYIGDNLRFMAGGIGKLTRLIGALSVLAEEVDAAEVARLRAAHELGYYAGELELAASQSLAGIEQVAHIVRSMKDFSHPGTVSKISLDINRAIENTVTVTRNEWRQVARVVTDLAPDLPHVTCQPGAINQVFLNLIINAAQAIASGKRQQPGVIHVSSRRDGGMVEVRVADDGPGVPPAIRGRIFDPFFTTKEVGKGTGQGLAICLDLVMTKHGGVLFLDDTPPPGAVFVLRLPLEPDDST